MRMELGREEGREEGREGILVRHYADYKEIVSQKISLGELYV